LLLPLLYAAGGYAVRHFNVLSFLHAVAPAAPKAPVSVSAEVLDFVKALLAAYEAQKAQAPVTK
jgi:hypothetical protein